VNRRLSSPLRASAELLRVSREQTVLKNLYYVKKGDTSAGARRLYIADVVFAGASERDLEGKFCARHFEMNAEHRRISRKPASIRAHLLFSFHGALSAILLSCLSAKLIKRSMPRENRQGSISSILLRSRLPLRSELLSARLS